MDFIIAFLIGFGGSMMVLNAIRGNNGAASIGAIVFAAAIVCAYVDGHDCATHTMPAAPVAMTNSLSVEK